MAATPQNVEMEAAKFLHKLIQESTDEPTKLATKLHVILQHMRTSGKENSMPYQVISRAMETVINRHGLDIEALVSTRQPLTGGTQAGDSSLSQIAGSSQQIAMEKDSRKTLIAEETTKIATFSSKQLHGPGSAGHDIYQGSASQLNSIKSHGANAGVSGSYESTELGNPLPMQLSNSYDNQGASTLMHKDRRTETFSTSSLGDPTSAKGPAGKALEHEGGYPNMMANVNKNVQGGISNNVTEMAMLRNDTSRDTGKLPVVQSPVGSCTPFKEHHLKQLRAQCLVFLAFRNNLMPKKLHLEIALGNFFPKEDVSSKEHIDQKGKEQSIGGQSISPEVAMHPARVDNARESERHGPGSSITGFIPETNLSKEAEKLDRVVDKNGPSSGLPEHGEGMRNNLMPRKLEAETQALETKESLSATKLAHPDPTNNAVPTGMEGNLSGHGHLPGFPLRESWKSQSGMEGERHMLVPKSASALEKDFVLGNNREEEDNSELSPMPPSPRYTTSEKWIADCQKRKSIAEHSWAVKKKKMEQRISTCAEKLKETVSSSEDISAKTRSVIELKKLELLNLQRRLRNEILNDFFKPISIEMDRLKSIKKHRIGRRSKQLERYEQKMKEERLKRIRERQKDFFGEMELHKERLEDVFKFRRERAKGFNKFAREFHKRKERLHREKIDRIQREKINLLKINDVEGYLRMVQDAKSDRVKQLLKETESYLQKLGSKLKEAKVMSRCFEADASGVNESNDFTIEDEDETDQAKHYMESNEKYYKMAHSIKETVAEQPTSLIGGKLREYQMNGLRWLLSLYNNHLNGILADEMGLGKTVQVISLLCYLMENKNDRGPFLVVVPSSVLPGWETEINFWAPSINKIIYSGPPEERRKLFKERIVQQKFNVLLTTYEYLMNKHDRPKLSKIHWHYVIIDEGHRIKNASCKLNADLKHYHSSHRLLLTGTPLQNNLEELWALLNFLLPNIFNSSEDFSQWFNKPFESNADSSLEEALLSEEENLLIINRLHQVLRPFVLRRLKHKVENQLPEKIERLVRCEASAYQKLLMQRVEDNLGAFGASKARAVHNSVVELRNICNHPYLSQLHTEEVHDFIPKHYLPNVIRLCGKLEMLDRLLPKLKATDHRVLLFSTMTRLLDVMEDYLYWKQYKYLRLDGHTCGGDRGALIDQFNKPGSPYFIFLLSIRAGGVGVNLQAADTVIIFDTDWNPQVDLQAQARAHRIGQKKDVLVLRLETVKTVEEQVRASAEHKLGVANQSITAGFFDNNTSAEDRREYLESLLRECKKEEAAPVLNDDALNDLIARSESEIDVFEELDKKRQEEEMIVWKKLVLEVGGISGELIPPLPSRLVTDDDLKSFCEAMKAIEVPKPVVVSSVGGKRKSDSLGSFDTQQYGRGKRAREVRSYEEQLTEDEFEKLCQVEAPDSPNLKEEGREKDFAIFANESSITDGVKSEGLPKSQPTRTSEELTIQQVKEVTPPSKRGRGRPKKKTTEMFSSSMGLSTPVPASSSARNVTGNVNPLGLQIAPLQSTPTGRSGFNSSPTDGDQSTATLASASDTTLTVPPGFQPTTNHPPGFQPTTTPVFQPTATPPPGYQPKPTPPHGYQNIATAPPGFQPKATPPTPLAGSQVTTSLPSGPQSTPAVPSGSQSDPTLPSGSQLTPSLPAVSQSNTMPQSTSISNSNLPPGTQSSPTFPLGSVSPSVLPSFSPGSQSATPPVAPGRGRGRGRGRPRGRGRGRGQIIESRVDVSQPLGRMKNIESGVDVSLPRDRIKNVESGVEVSQPQGRTTNIESEADLPQPRGRSTNIESEADMPQPRGRITNNVVLAIPGLRASSVIGKPATGSPVVAFSTSQTVPESSVSGSTSINDGRTVIPPHVETPKSSIVSPKTSVKDSPSVATSSVLTGIGGAVQEPDAGTTPMIPRSNSVSVGSKSTEPTPPLVTVPLGSHSVSPSDSEPKQSRGRGRRAQSGMEAPRRRVRKKEDVVDDQGKSNEPPEKKPRVSSGRKSVATRSMLRNEAQKNPNDTSTTNDHSKQGSNLFKQSQNSSRNENEQPSTLTKFDILAKSSDASTVDNRTVVLGNSVEKVVKSKDSMTTEAGSRTHEAKKLANLEQGESEVPGTINSGTLERRESDPSKDEVSHEGDNSSQQVEVFQAEAELEARETEGSALHGATDLENKTEVLEAKNESSVQKKAEERDSSIRDGGTPDAMESSPAGEINVALHRASGPMKVGNGVTAATEENVVEIAQDTMVPAQLGELQKPGITGGGVENKATPPEKLKEISQGGIEQEKKEQGTNDPIREKVDDIFKTSLELPVEQGKSDGLGTNDRGIVVETAVKSSDKIKDALQGEIECNKGALEASDVSGGNTKNVSEDEKTPKQPPVGNGEKDTVNIDRDMLLKTDAKVSEKTKDAFKGKTAMAGIDDIAENVIDDQKTPQEVLVGQGETEGVETIAGGSLVDNDGKLSQEVDDSSKGEHKQEMEGSDACGGIEENVTEARQTEDVPPGITGEKEDHEDINGHSLAETDAEPSEKTEVAHQEEPEVPKSELRGDGAHDIAKNVAEDEKPAEELPAAQDEKEVLGTVDGFASAETKVKTFAQDEDDLQGDAKNVECSGTSDGIENVIEAQIPLGRDDRGDVDTDISIPERADAKPYRELNNAGQVETESKQQEQKGVESVHTTGELRVEQGEGKDNEQTGVPSVKSTKEDPVAEVPNRSEEDGESTSGLNESTKALKNENSDKQKGESEIMDVDPSSDSQTRSPLSSSENKDIPVEKKETESAKIMANAEHKGEILTRTEADETDAIPVANSELKSEESERTGAADDLKIKESENDILPVADKVQVLAGDATHSSKAEEHKGGVTRTKSNAAADSKIDESENDAVPEQVLAADVTQSSQAEEHKGDDEATRTKSDDLTIKEPEADEKQEQDLSAETISGESEAKPASEPEEHKDEKVEAATEQDATAG